MPTQRIPLAQQIESRQPTFAKDSKSVNCYFESRSQLKDVIKRPGLTKVTNIGTTPTPPAVLQGQGLAEFRTQVVSIVNNVVYRTDPITYETLVVGTITGPIEQNWFVKTFLDAYLVFHNANTAYAIDSSWNLTQLKSDYIIDVRMLTGGTSYTTATVHFGDLWLASTSVTMNQVIYYGTHSYIVTTPGTTGTSPPTFTSGSAANGTATLMYMTNPAVATANIDLGVITSVTITNPGSGYVVAPTVTFTGDGTPAATATAILNAFPTPNYVPGTVFLDQYVFIGGCDNRIYSSNLNQPTKWSALDYISFEQGPDRLLAISRHLNYLVGFGEWTMQLYYDAGNPNGSPLAVASSYMTELGCAAPASIVQSEQTVFWVGQSKANGPSVYLLEGTSPLRISTSNIDRFLQASTLQKVTAYTVKVNGHLFYVLTLHDLNVTIVYDAVEKMWHQWTQWAKASNDQPNPNLYSESYFRPCYYAAVIDKPFVLDDDNGSLYILDPYHYLDDEAPIYYRIVTEIMDSGITKRKFYSKVEIIGDKVPATMMIRHTGDDYNNWSNYRPVMLNNPRAQAYQLGQDRRRAWEFLCTDAVPLRLNSAELDFKIGEMDQEQMVGG
jgi:hypothetical protein